MPADIDESKPIEPVVIDEDERRQIEAAQVRFKQMVHEPMRPRVVRLTIGELTYCDDFRGLLRLTGYIALVLGMAALSGILCGVQFTTNDGRVQSPEEIAKFAAVFLATAAVFLLGRRVRRFDRAGGRVTLWWGVLGPWWRRNYNLLDYNAVQITPELRQHKRFRWLVYRVELVGLRTDALTLWTLRIQADAEAIASEVAEFLGWRVMPTALLQRPIAASE